MDEQRSFEWYRSRWGKITMSKRIDVIMTGRVITLNNLLRSLRWERDQKDEVIRQHYEKAMQTGDRVANLAWGREHEDEAIKFYEMTRNVEVIRPPFIQHPHWYEFVGASTDFLETEDGTREGKVIMACEIKCPTNTSNHLKTLRYGMPSMYHNQTQGNLECNSMMRGRYISYDPRHPVDDDKLYVEDIKADVDWQKRFRDRMVAFANCMRHGTLFDQPMPKATDGLPSMF